MMLIGNPTVDHTGPFPSREWIADAMADMYGKDAALDTPFAMVDWAMRTRTLFFGWCFLAIPVMGWITILSNTDYRLRAVGGFQYVAITINIFVAVTTALNVFFADYYFVPKSVRGFPGQNIAIICAQSLFVLINTYNIIVGHKDAAKLDAQKSGGLLGYGYN